MAIGFPGMSTNVRSKACLSSIVSCAVLASVLVGCIRSQGRGQLADAGRKSQPMTRLTVADLDLNALYSEAKERGIDLRAPSTSRRLREAFLYLDFVGGSAKFGEDKAVREAATVLADELATTGTTSILRVRTGRPGAAVTYRSIARKVPISASQLTNDTQELVPIGYYFIWASHDGNQTPMERVYRVVAKTVEVHLAEQPESDRW